MALWVWYYFSREQRRPSGDNGSHLQVFEGLSSGRSGDLISVDPEGKTKTNGLKLQGSRSEAQQEEEFPK